MKFNQRNIYISPKAVIGNNVKIGDNTTIYDNVRIGDDTIIANDCIIGEPANDYYFDSGYENAETNIGANCLIRSGAIVYADVQLGDGFSCGHRVTIREKTVFGKNCRVGTLSDIQGYVRFGDHCWLHSNVFVAQYTEVGNFVFLYPHVMLANDKYPPSNNVKGATIGDYSQVAANSTVLGGITIGQHVLVGAASLVMKDAPDYALILGNPGKQIKDVRDLISKETNKPHYPWPENFERGMPWEGVGYQNWIQQNH